jgi:ubiquinone biosynthesis protein
MNVVLSVLLLILFVIAVGKLTGRLLGIRLGNLRGAIVGLIGWVAGLLAAIYIVGEASGSWRRIDVETAGDGISVIAIVLVFGVLAAMPVAIVIDLITRTGPPHGPRRRRRRLLHPIRAVRAALAPYGRLRELVANARRENLLHFRYASRSALESPDLSRRLRAVLEDSGGMLVKLGQIASTRTDVLPAATTEELAKLRADVRKVPEAEVREMLETELGEPVERAFGSFEFEPLAAASIGQTHRAVLADGTPVVVKVQRPGIDEVVARDAAVLRLATSQLERRVEAARAIRLGDFSEELIAGLEEELDYLHEGAVGTRLRENRATDAGIAVPRVHASLSTARVLVMEQVVARPIVDPEALGASPVPRDELARRLLASFIGQVLDDGLFHADPHPGNLLLDAQGTIWMLDFGSVGRLDARALDGLRGIALGVATDEPGILARAARTLAGDDGFVDLRALETDMSVQLGALDEPGGLDPRVIGEVLAVMQRHGMRPPSSITLLARALITLEGTLRGIDPGLSLVKTSREVVMTDHRDAFGTPQELLQREALTALPALRTLPEHAETLANQLRSGRLTVRTERFAGADRDVVDAWVDRLVIALIAGMSVIGSAVVLLAAAMTGSDDIRTALWILGFAGLTFSTTLAMRGAARALRRHLERVT